MENMEAFHQLCWFDIFHPPVFFIDQLLFFLLEWPLGKQFGSLFGVGLDDERMIVS